MDRLVAYKMTVTEAEERLRCAMDNSGLKLVRHVGDMDFPNFFYAVSDSQCLDGAEIDERFAQILGVKTCKHYVTEDGGFLAVVMEG